MEWKWKSVTQTKEAHDYIKKKAINERYRKIMSLSRKLSRRKKMHPLHLLSYLVGIRVALMEIENIRFWMFQKGPYRYAEIETQKDTGTPIEVMRSLKSLTSGDE